MTLLEMVIAAAIFATLLSAVGLTVTRGTGLYRSSLTAKELDAMAARSLERIVDELIAADRSTLALNPPAPFGAFSVNYARAAGMVGGVLVVGDTRRIRARIDDTELDNGVDDDGDGMVDEMRLELSLDTVGAPAQAIGIGNFVREFLEGEVFNGADDNGNGIVDERGLCITYNALSTIATVRLSLERPDADGRPVVRTVEAAVQVRND